MSLPLYPWLSRRLARFLRCTWMSRFLIGPAAMGGTTWFGQGKKARPKADTRLSLERLETRLVPQDMLGVLHTGMSIAGAPVLMGTIPSPGQVFLDGWVDHNKPAVLPADFSTSVDTAAQPANPEPAPGQLEALASLATNASHDSGGGASASEVQPAAVIEPVAQSQQGDYALTSWLDAVGAFLNSPPAHGSVPANTEPSGTNGGGGGGSDAPGSGLNGATPAAPMPAGSPNVPDARSAGQMAQSPASSAPVVLSSGGRGAGPVRSSGPGSSGPVALPDDQQGNGSQGGGSSNDNPVAQPTLATNFGQVPLPFEVNAGQTDPSVLALSNGPGLGFWLTDSSMVFSVPHADAQTGQQSGSDVFTLAMVNGNASPAILPGDPLPSRANYFVGSNSSQWLSDVPQYGEINEQGVYPGIDLVLHSASMDSRIFEYDFQIQPGSDVSSIQLNPEGLQSVQIDDQGRLLLGTSGGNVIMDAPIMYQTINGQQTDVAGGYVLNDNGTIGFQVTGSYDPSQVLVIDPQLSFSSYVGGSGNDYAYGIAVGADGNSYIAGKTSSANFPTTNGYQSALAGTTDVFVSKLNAQGTGVVYSTYIGGSGGLGSGVSAAAAIAIDLSGNAYVVGQTNATNYPTTVGAYETSISPGLSVGFVTKLNATGDALEYSTFLSGGGIDFINGIAVDTSGQAYLTGTTGMATPSFPTTAGALQTSYGGGSDAFVTKLNSTGSALVYSTLLGGSQNEFGNAIAVDSSGDAYVTGATASTNFPVASAYQSSLAGSENAFVVKLNASASAEVYGTYLGGNLTDIGQAIAVGRDGKVYVTGSTNSSSFPIVSGAYQSTLAMLSTDAFVTAFNAAGSALTMSTYLGGTGSSAGDGYGIAVDTQGRPTVVGTTTSSTFPTYLAFQSSSGGGTDGFVTRLTPTGTLSYSSYLGGSSTDEARAVALDPFGAAYVTGDTNSTNLPGTTGSAQASNAGGYDAFLSKVLPEPDAPVITAISSDTGSSSTDHITTAQNLHISGTSDANVTITLERVDLGVIGTVTSSAGGTWTYDYTATTLTQDTYDFIARASDGSGNKSSYSNDFLVSVDLTAPTVVVSVPATTTSLGPTVRVTASDMIGIPANATVTLDVDLNNNGNFTDAGETGYATGTLVNGQANIKLPALPGTGTYRVEARLSDLADNQGTSTAQTFVVNAATSWSGTAEALSADPAGDWTDQVGDVSISQSLDLDQSPGMAQSGNAGLTYHSSQVSQKPIVQLQLDSANNASLPSTISAQLTFNGTAASTVTYNTTGMAEGDMLTMALQASSAITTTGGYSWSVSVTAGSFSNTYTGYSFIVAQDSSPLGAGWSFAGLNQLVSISASGSVPAGMLMVYGSGGYRFFTGTSSFTSPAGDNGTLSVSGGTYTYSTPDGESWTYNSSGYETQWTSADGNETLQYRYDGSNRLTGITAIDGAVTTLTYTGSTSVSIQTVNSRTTTLTLSSANLAEITNPDGGVQTLTYDGSHHLTREQFGLLENNWAYTAAGVVGTYTWGATSVGGVNNPSLTTYLPDRTQGLSALVAGTVYASQTNPDSDTTQYQLDSQGRPLAVIAANGGIDSMTYSNGFLTSQTDPLNRTTTYALDSAGYTTLETLPDGSTITMQYQTAFHALTTMTDERGNTTTYAYDSGGHLTGTTDALSDHTTYSYTGSGLLQSVTDANNHTTTYQYDADRRLTTTTDALNHKTTITYDANGNEQTITDALAHVTTISHDVMGRPTVTTDALGDKTTTTYDVSGLALTTTNALGTETSTIYDTFKRGLVVETIDGAGGALQVSSLADYDNAGQVTAMRDATGWWAFTSYDAVGQAVGTADALGNTTQTDYDLAGQMTASRDQMGHWTTYAYNSRGQQSSVTDALGDITESAYDEAGNMTSSMDALNHTTTYAYDALNNETVTTDPMGNKTTTTYDPVSNVLTTETPNGNTTSYAYDALNRQTAMTEAVGTAVAKTTSIGYDAVGDVTTTTDGNGNVTTISYDPNRRETQVTDPLNHETTMTYDAVGDILTQKNALAQVTTYSYNSLQQRITSTDSLANTTTMILDARGQQVASIDPLGNVVINIFNSLGQVVGSMDALGNVPQTVLDPMGGTRMVVDADGNETHYVSDLPGQVKEIITSSGTTTGTYDAASRLTTTTDANGRVIQYSYDNDDRLTGEVWKTNAGVTLNVVTFTWDDDDNLLSATNSTGTETYTYDALDRLQTDTNVWGQVLTYSYDGNDNVTHRSDSLGGILTYVYDAASRLTSEQFSGTGPTGTVIRVDFGYNAINQQTTISWYSNLAGTILVADSVYSYDSGDRLTSIINTNGASATLSYYNYSYDNDDRVTTQTRYSQVGTTVYSGTNTYTYDASSQLLSDSTTTYTYDSNGNRTMNGYTTGGNNQITNDGTYTYTYDAEGNQTSKTTGTGSAQVTWTYSYDNANEMIGVVEIGSTGTLIQITYTYDAESHLVEEQVWSGGSTTTTRFALAGAYVWADLDGSNIIVVRYEYGAGTDQILTRSVASGGNAGVWAYLTDDQGSVRDLVNWSGQVQDHLDYTGFGIVAETNPSVGSRFEFDGYQYAAPTGLYYVNARWYNPVVGDWTQMDPLGFEAGDTNLYRYVQNSPLRFVDPSGLYPKGNWWYIVDEAIQLAANMGVSVFANVPTSQISPGFTPDTTVDFSTQNPSDLLYRRRWLLYEVADGDNKQEVADTRTFLQNLVVDAFVTWVGPGKSPALGNQAFSGSSGSTLLLGGNRLSWSLAQPGLILYHETKKRKRTKKQNTQQNTTQNSTNIVLDNLGTGILALTCFLIVAGAIATATPGTQPLGIILIKTGIKTGAAGIAMVTMQGSSASAAGTSTSDSSPSSDDPYADLVPPPFFTSPSQDGPIIINGQ